MKNKEYNLSTIISENDILKKLEYIGNKKLTPTGHGFDTFGSIPILESSLKSTLNYSLKPQEKPAIALIEVVLAANRNFNKVVEPNIKRIEKEFPELKNFQHLNEILFTKTKEDFYSFWGHKDEKKYETLKNILSKIDDLRKIYPNENDDFSLMNQWGNNADLTNYKNDYIGSVPNVAIATFQHLRMVFGVDTIKPDQRVKEVLDYEFGLSKLSDLNVIKTVEKIAEIANMKVITIDQIFVQYGSSYYNQSANKISLKQIVSKLKSFGVDNEIISKSTLLTLGQVEKIK